MANYNDLGLNRQAKAGFQIPLAPMVPNNGLSDGIAPAGTFRVAPYLPLLRYNDDKYTYVVVGSGRPVAQDSNGAVVPAGLRLDYAAWKADATKALVKYTSLDVQNGIRNAAGNLVTDGEAVVASFDTAGIKVGPHIGVAPYDYFQHAGGDNLTPTATNYINFNIQPVIAVLRDYHMQYPVVASAAIARTSALKGMSVVIGKKADIEFGGFITYDAESNFVVDTAPSFVGTVGQVTGLRVYKDDTTNAVIGDHNLLNRVVAPNAATKSVLDQVANVNNDGLGSFIRYSGGWGVVEFGLINR